MEQKTAPRPLNIADETEFFRLVQVPPTDGETRRGFVAGVACQPHDEPEGEALPLWVQGYREGTKVRRQIIGAAMSPMLSRLQHKMVLAVLGEAQRVGKAALA